jgi:hypothetical protein
MIIKYAHQIDNKHKISIAKYIKNLTSGIHPKKRKQIKSIEVDTLRGRVQIYVRYRRRYYCYEITNFTGTNIMHIRRFKFLLNKSQYRLIGHKDIPRSTTGLPVELFNEK